MTEQRKKPEILNTHTLAAEEVASSVYEIEQLHLRFSNGEERQFRRMKSSGRGAVLIIPLQDNETVLLVREYAAGVDRYELQLPKGRIEKDESPEEAANRELKEELGFGAKRLEHFKSLTIAPAFMSHQTHLVLAQDLYPERLEGDEPEELEIVPWRLDNLEALVEQRDCTEARSIAALFMTREILRKIKS